MEKQEPIFPDGLNFFRPHPKSPDFVKGTLSIQPERFIAWLTEHGDDKYVKLDLKLSKNREKLYFQLNTWKPKEKTSNELDFSNDEVDPDDEVDISDIPE